MEHKLKSEGFVIFGSASSIDADILVFVDDFPSAQDRAQVIVGSYEQLIRDNYPEIGKELNCNLAVLSECGTYLCKCFKGEPTEVNNSIIATYENHKQYFPNPLSTLLERNEILKMARIFRALISFYSRFPDIRKDVKQALRGTLKEKIDLFVSEKIKLSERVTEFVGKKESTVDVYKVIAFQLAQGVGLIESVEHYSKEGIVYHYPELSKFILRQPFDDCDLQTFDKFLYEIISDIYECFPEYLDMTEVEIEEKSKKHIHKVERISAKIKMIHSEKKAILK